jgi:hypothetical protein
MAYYGPIGPAVQHISAVMEQELLTQIAPGSLVHTTRIGRGFLSCTAYNLARKGDVPFIITANHHPHGNGTCYREYRRLYRGADAVIALGQHGGG